MRGTSCLQEEEASAELQPSRPNRRATRRPMRARSAGRRWEGLNALIGLSAVLKARRLQRWPSSRFLPAARAVVSVVQVLSSRRDVMPLTGALTQPDTCPPPHPPQGHPQGRRDASGPSEEDPQQRADDAGADEPDPVGGGLTPPPPPGRKHTKWTFDMD